MRPKRRTTRSFPLPRLHRPPAAVEVSPGTTFVPVLVRWSPARESAAISTDPRRTTWITTDFVSTALEQVHLVLEGEAHLVLYDDSGRLLAEGSGLQSPSRIVHLWTQLPEGRYFARVYGGSGPYRILLEKHAP